MPDPTPLRRASSAQPKMQAEQKQAIERNLDQDEKRLLKAEKRASFANGAIIGGLFMLFLGVGGTLIITTALFDPISKSASQNVATGAAIAARGD